MTITLPNHAAIRSAVVWSIALAGLTLATDSWAEEARKGTVSDKGVQAKLQYCKVCHGVSAQGFRGYYPIPRLAGQQPIYLENQLQAFIEHRRTNNVMFNVAHSLSPSMVAALTGQISARSIHHRLAARRGSSWRQAEKSSKTGCRIRTSRHALRATDRTLRAAGKFLD